MRNTTFSPQSLLKELLTIDFHDYRSLALKDPGNLDRIASEASELAHRRFNGSNPLVLFTQNGKQLFQSKGLSQELILRKLRFNLSQAKLGRTFSREEIVKNLPHFLAEGVPYRLYRLDIKSFYESFDPVNVEATISGARGLSALTKELLIEVLTYQKLLGGAGVPRGLAISAPLSDMMMSSFDTQVVEAPSVYFYARYVDDMLIVTNAQEDSAEFVSFIEARLQPIGLTLNKGESKFAIVETPNRSKPQSATRAEKLSFE